MCLLILIPLHVSLLKWGQHQVHFGQYLTKVEKGLDITFFFCYTYR